MVPHENGAPHEALVSCAALVPHENRAPRVPLVSGDALVPRETLPRGVGRRSYRPITSPSLAAPLLRTTFLMRSRTGWRSAPSRIALPTSRTRPASMS